MSVFVMCLTKLGSQDVEPHAWKPICEEAGKIRDSFIEEEDIGGRYRE